MQLIDEQRSCVSNGAVDGAAAGVAVTTAAEAFCDLGDIDRTLAAQVKPETVAGRQLAEEDSSAHAKDADEVIHDTLAVLDDRVGSLHVVERDVSPGHLAIDLEVGERGTEQADFALRVGEVDGLSDAGGVGAALQQMLRETKGERVRAGEGESTGVRKNSSIETAGHRRCDLFAGGDGELIDHDADGAGSGIDPVEVGEGAAALMVIDVDDHAGFNLVEACALDRVALEQDGDVVNFSGEFGNDAFDAWETAVHRGDAVGKGDGDALAHGLDEVHEAEGRADGVAVRASVRRDEEALVVADDPKDPGNGVGTHHGLAVALLRGCGRLALYFFAVLSGAAQDFIHACVNFFRAIDGEGELGHVTNTHALANLGTNVVARGDEAVECALLRFLVPVHGDEDTTAFASGSEHDLGDVTGRDARVGEFPFEHGGDLLGKGTGDSITVILSGSLLWHR